MHTNAATAQLSLSFDGDKQRILRVGDLVYSDIIPRLGCYGLVVYVSDPGADVVQYNVEYSFTRRRVPVSVGDPNYIILLGDTMVRICADVMKSSWHLTETISSLTGANNG